MFEFGIIEMEWNGTIEGQKNKPEVKHFESMHL